MRLKEKISNALATSDNTNEYANPIFPNKLPRVKIPITSMSIETILVITIYPLFSRARNSCAKISFGTVVDSHLSQLVQP